MISRILYAGPAIIQWITTKLGASRNRARWPGSEFRIDVIRPRNFFITDFINIGLRGFQTNRWLKRRAENDLAMSNGLCWHLCFRTGYSVPMGLVVLSVHNKVFLIENGDDLWIIF